uniref:RING finger protein 145-like n=1 Tax=Myxine glutinosa TaxID=7769 RepID=UPI00358E6BC6
MSSWERLQAVGNVVLRVPSILVLERLYRWDGKEYLDLLGLQDEQLLAKYQSVVCNLFYLGHILSIVALSLPLQRLVKLYVCVLTAALLFTGHHISRYYIEAEIETEYGGSVFAQSEARNRFLASFAGQLVVCSLCSLLMQSKRLWLFSAHLLPLFARLCAVPFDLLPLVNKFAMAFTALEVLYYLVSNFGVPYDLAKSAYREAVQMIQMYGWLALGMGLWNQLLVPMLFMVFWLVLLSVHIYSYVTSRGQAVIRERLLLVVLTSVAECCGTPYSLLGLTFTVSYLALGILTMGKFYLQGFQAFANDNVMHRGVTEGATLLLLAVQTGLMELQVLQRAFLLTIMLFIVVASTLQSMLEMADPIVLALGASRNRSVWKHFRAISLCLFLFLFPLYMTYTICRFFVLDFWLLIIISSSVLTSLQVACTLFNYLLFVYEELRKQPLENLDDIVYCIHSMCRMLEFVVAVGVVGYGTTETVLGEWSWLGVGILFVHAYYNVWLRAQHGWRSFLRRREAVGKINSLPTATAMQLHKLQDVCSICYQDMESAVMTPCGHFFHPTCLRKWLYLQETCPMCHQSLGACLTPARPTENPGAGHTGVRPTEAPDAHSRGEGNVGESQRFESAVGEGEATPERSTREMGGVEQHEGGLGNKEEDKETNS